jgi:hypothetical protein
VKRTWGIINELINLKKQNNSHVKEIKLNGSSVNDPPGLSETFNTHFASIGPKLMEKIPCDENNCSYLEYLNCHISGNTFELNSTTSSMVCSLLDKLCKSKATCLDKISAKLLLYCPDLLSESLPKFSTAHLIPISFLMNGNAQKSFHYLNTVSVGT